MLAAPLMEPKSMYATSAPNTDSGRIPAISFQPVALPSML
jgi:hypothetical protein